MRLLIPDLQPNTSYALQVRANGGGNDISEWSNRYIFVTMQDSLLPVVPANVSWVSSGDSFYGKWDTVSTNSAGEAITIDRYEIELTSSPNTVIVAVPQSTQGNPTYTLSFEDNRALFGNPRGSVGFRVRAVDNKDLKSGWSSIITATNAPPANPTSVTAVADINAIALSWTPPSDTDLIGYNIYQGSTKLAFTAGTSWIYTTTTYTSTSLTVKAVDRFGQESTGAASNSVTPISPFVVDTTAPPVPTGLTATLTNNVNEDGARAAVLWTMSSPPSDLAGFYIRFRKVGDTDYAVVPFQKDDRSGTIELGSAYTNYEFQIKAFDWSANESAWSSTVTATAPSNSAPSQPAAPTASAGTMQIQVSHSGLTQAGGAMEGDVVRYNVYASTTTGFTPSAANMLGSMANGPAIVETFNIPASGGGTTETWFVKVIAVDRGGLQSAASNQATATVGLILATNIVDATITNAKIADLAANKITAGSGFVNDITVKSKFTLGDASTTGAIESFGYVAGTTGFHLDKTLLEINQGSIAASALKLQVGYNIVLPQYADFEWSNSYYTTGITVGTGSPTRTTVAGGRFNTQSYSALWSTTPITLYLGTSTTNYNIQIDAGVNYIFSIYAWNTGSVNTNVQLRVKWSDGTLATAGSATINAGTTPATATRISGMLTAPAGVTGAVVFIESSNTTANSSFNIDGLQVERQSGNLTTPSAWNPPGATTIRGDMIKTGAIQSTDVGKVTVATPVYSSDGTSILYYSNPTEINDPNSQPAWTINTTGNATFGSVLIRGNVVIGNPNGTTSADTADPYVFTANTHSNTTLDNAPAGTFLPVDVGLPISGSGIPFGATVAAYISPTAVTLSAAATATATGVSITLTRNKRTVASMSSADFVPFSKGWTIRSDGHAQFPSMAIGSLDGKALKANTVSADTISGGTLMGTVALAGSFETSSAPITVTGATTNASMTVTSDPTGEPFTLDDVGITIAGAGIPAGTTITNFVNANQVTISQNATATASSVPLNLYRGRTVRFSGGDGIQLLAANHTPIISLPTDPSQPAEFFGSVTATDLLVNDDFRMEGVNNSLGQGSVLTLSPSNYKPGTYPNVVSDWTSPFRMKQWNGDYWNPSADPFVTYTHSAVMDYVSGNVLMTDYSTGEGAIMYRIDSTGKKLDNIYLGQGLNGGTNDDPRGGVAVDSGFYYFLTYNAVTFQWRLQSFPRSVIESGVDPQPSDRIVNQVWSRATSDGGLTGRPCMAIYGSDIYLAKISSTNTITMYRYGGLNIAAAVPDAVHQTTVPGTGCVESIQVGKFDFADTTKVYQIVGTRGNSSSDRINRVFWLNTSTWQFVHQNKDFQTPYGKTPAGIVYIGAHRDDATGFFRSFTTDGYAYDHPPVGKDTTGATNATTGSIYISQRWRDAVGGTVSLEGPVGLVSFTRRARLTVTSKSAIPDANAGAGPSPNAVTFYINATSTSSATRYRYPEPAIGVNYTTITTDFRTTDASTTGAAAMPDGVPSKIAAASGLEIDGSGAIKATSLSLNGGQTLVGIQSGTVLANATAGANATTTVTFPVPFTVAPKVVCSPLSAATDGTTGIRAFPSGVTATGFTLNFFRNTATATNVFWIAIV